jgi:hypothetical protein
MTRSLCLTGGSSTGLSATGASQRAAAGDASTLRLIQTDSESLNPATALC